MEKFEAMTTSELLDKRFIYDLTSKLANMPSIAGGFLLGNGLVKQSTPFILAGSIIAIVSVGTSIFFAGKVEKIDKIRKEKQKQSEKEHNDRIFKIQHNYQESDIISEDYKEIE